MPDPLSHHPTMLRIIRPTLPRFWWLNPWAHALYLNTAATALRQLADSQDRVILMQISVIEDLQNDIMRGASVKDAGPIPEDCES